MEEKVDMPRRAMAGLEAIVKMFRLLVSVSCTAIGAARGGHLPSSSQPFPRPSRGPRNRLRLNNLRKGLQRSLNAVKLVVQVHYCAGRSRGGACGADGREGAGAEPLPVGAGQRHPPHLAV